MVYEIIYEAGHHSLASYESDEEALRAIGEQHRRARSGEKNGPQGAPADRIVRVEVYDKHPDEFNSEQNLSEDVARSELADALAKATEGGVTDLQALVANIRDIANPRVEESGPHETNFKMEAVRVLTEGWEDYAPAS